MIFISAYWLYVITISSPLRMRSRELSRRSILIILILSWILRRSRRRLLSVMLLILCLINPFLSTLATFCLTLFRSRPNFSADRLNWRSPLLTADPWRDRHQSLSFRNAYKTIAVSRSFYHFCAIGEGIQWAEG